MMKAVIVVLYWLLAAVAFLEGVSFLQERWAQRSKKRREPVSQKSWAEAPRRTAKPKRMALTAERSTVRLSCPLMSVGTVEAEWRRADKPEFRRIPEEKIVRFGKNQPLTILNERYPGLFDADSPFGNLTHGRQTTDRYGRDIICFLERFPCFDSEDYANENRYFRWFFVREGDVIARVFYEDETDEVIVTEDVRYIETSCWEELRKTRFCQADKTEE